MTHLLVRLFIKDYENIHHPKVRAAYGVMAGIVGILCNALLFGMKLAIGLAMNSISVMADAFNNLSDAGSSVIGFIGVKLAQRPADKEHPFGHGRLEYISALVVAFLILQVGFTLLKNSFLKILRPEEMGFSWVSLLILGLSMLIKLWLSLFNKKLGSLIDSKVMKAAAADSLSDVMVTAATVVSITVGRFTGLHIDGWMGLIVSIFVLLSGYKIARATLMPLLGEAVNRDLYTSITSKVESYEGILNTHDLIVHNYGPSHTMASIHAEVPNDSDMEKIHGTIDRIERDVYKELGIFLVIHMDPVEVKDKDVLDKKNMLLKVIGEIDPKATVHDFRVVKEGGTVNLIFDLVVPHSYDEKDERELSEKISRRIREIDERIHCIIEVENSYIAE